MELNESGLKIFKPNVPLVLLPPAATLPPVAATESQSLAATAAASAPSPTNGTLPNTERALQLMYLQSVPSAVTPPLETVRRKRGRPRENGTPEHVAAAKRAPSASSVPISPPKIHSLGDLGCASSSSSPKKTQLAGLGNLGQCFSPRIISITAREDVYQKIMLFMQQSKCEICILSAASGSINNSSLCQPATSGGNITYQGWFDILSLSGSYIRTELGGRTGGLNVCLSSTDGQIVGGGIGGALKAAGPVQGVFKL